MLLDGLVDVNCVKCRYIKAGQPHINDNRNFEVGFYILKLTVKLLAIILRSKHFIKLWLVIFISRHDELDLLDGLEFFLLFFCQHNPIRTDLFLCPFRSHPDNNLIKGVCYFAIGADKHCFSCNGSSFGNAGHCVGIDNRTEDFNRAIYGCTCKTNIGCIGERIM